jgi:Nuclease-related domain
MSGRSFPEDSADKSAHALDGRRHEHRKFIGLAAGCLVFVVCLAYVSYLFSDHHFSFFEFACLMLFVLFVVVVDRIVLPRMDGLQKWDEFARRGAAADKKIGALLEELPDDYVVMHDLKTGEGRIDHLVFRKDGAIFLIETQSHDGDVTQRNGKLLRNGRPFEKDFVRQAVQNIFWARNFLKTRLGFEPWVYATIVFPDAYVARHLRVKGVNIIHASFLLRWMQQAAGDSRVAETLWSQAAKLKNELIAPASIHLAPLMSLR